MNRSDTNIKTPKALKNFKVISSQEIQNNQLDYKKSIESQDKERIIYHLENHTPVPLCSDSREAIDILAQAKNLELLSLILEKGAFKNFPYEIISALFMCILYKFYEGIDYLFDKHFSVIDNQRDNNSEHYQLIVSTIIERTDFSYFKNKNICFIQEKNKSLITSFIFAPVENFLFIFEQYRQKDLKYFWSFITYLYSEEKKLVVINQTNKIEGLFSLLKNYSYEEINIYISDLNYISNKGEDLNHIYDEIKNSYQKDLLKLHGQQKSNLSLSSTRQHELDFIIHRMKKITLHHEMQENFINTGDSPELKKKNKI